MNISAIDPGGTTGWAWIAGGFFRVGSFPESTGLGDLITAGTDVVIYERCLQTPQSNPIAREVTGVIKYLASQRGIKTLRQEPNVPGFINSVHPHFKKQIKGPIHCFDALSHLLFYLRSQGIDLHQVILNEGYDIKPEQTWRIFLPPKEDSK